MTSVVVMKLTATLVSTIGQARAKVAAISPRREGMALRRREGRGAPFSRSEPEGEPRRRSQSICRKAHASVRCIPRGIASRSFELQRGGVGGASEPVGARRRGKHGDDLDFGGLSR